MSSEEHELRWYLMSTKRGEEALVSKALESVCAEVFLPLIHQRPGSEPEPVFLRHIFFARVDWKKRRLAVAYSADMRDDLTSRQPPVELPDALVMELKAAAATRQQLRAAAAALISDTVSALFNRRIASLERTAALFRNIDERKALETSARG
jgi:hypothetical protein